MGEELIDTKKAMHLLHSLSSIYHTLSKILLHRQNTAVTYNEVVSALLMDAIEQDLLSPSIPSISGTALIMTRGQSQPKDIHNSRRPGLKRKRSKSLDRRKVQFMVQQFDKKNVVCWSCGKKSHIMKFCRMTSTTSPSVANVTEHLNTEANDLYTDDL